ncbi:hypothetical protein ULMS_09180 [Patiriisocius marinistellae]|uniref:Uncharacterized protein n=1 Tax=Patiriisocius marinistellae TaxID=2494560 RepID=A0A5J4FUB2_9FLAO|nr:hypothetical protein [Patiriisocius marinistellae]GEQ85410.1 hypothetical protein ULMS_09180 [Patiriisocius marinistellae]
MRISTKYLVLCILFFATIACETDDNSDGIKEPYYQFTSDDEELIIKFDYAPNQIITYKNQDGDELNFKVILNERKIAINTTRGTFAGGGGSFLNHYDSKIIRFEILENNNYQEEGLVNYIFSKNDDFFNYGINLPIWNKASFIFMDELANDTNIPSSAISNFNQTQLTVNNHQFNKVIIIESGSNEIYDNFQYGTLIKNVNKIYYDYDFGIIKFENINGDVWEVIYPE